MPSLILFELPLPLDEVFLEALVGPDASSAILGKLASLSVAEVLLPHQEGDDNAGASRYPTLTVHVDAVFLQLLSDVIAALFEMGVNGDFLIVLEVDPLVIGDFHVLSLGLDLVLFVDGRIEDAQHTSDPQLPDIVRVVEQMHIAQVQATLVLLGWLQD